MRQMMMWLVAAVLAFGVAACSGIKLLNAVVPDEGYVRTEDVAYGTGKRHKLDIYRPTEPLKGRPVALFIYGGSWQSGSKGDYRFVGQALASAGITTVIADYRVAPEVVYPSFLHDTAKALVWVRANIQHYGGNAENLFLIGHSAGAYNAIMVATNPAYVAKESTNPVTLRGAIGLAGPYNFLPIEDPDIIEIFGGANRPETQPITYVKPDLAPMLLVTGTSDTLVYPSNTTSMANALRKEHNIVETRFYPEVGHIGLVVSLADGFRNRAPAFADILAFIKRHSL